MQTLSYRSRNIAKDPEAAWGTTTRIDEALNHIAMELIGWFIFLSAVLVGSYIQAVVGFALAMVMMAIGGATGTITLPVLTAASSIIAFVQVVFALKGQSSFVHRSIFSWMIAGQIPAIGIGVWFLTVLDRDAQWFLQMLLGIFIIVGSSSMMIRPYPRHKVSTQRACLIAGIGGGLIGGMFSASGPIIGWFAYRQPLDL
ncbi:MAG: TSUP family transporter, partial [Gammaproteobacteria bacterium]